MPTLFPESVERPTHSSDASASRPAPWLPGSATAPWITAALPGLGGHIGPTPDDFRVTEIPAYSPCGEGTHFYVEVEKRSLSTGAVRDLLARAAGVRPMDIGFAGRKDTDAVTRQWFSLPCPPIDPAHPGVTLLGPAVRHGNKLRTGHLKGNAFEIRLIGLHPDAPVRWPALLAALHPGVPNYYGEQRFGRNNVGVAMAFLDDTRRRVRDPEFLASVVQSAVFNRWLGQRVLDGTLHRALAGDVLRKRDTGGLFVCEDPTADSLRVADGEVDPTGPLPGAKTMAAGGAAGTAEAAALAAQGLSERALAGLRRFAPGTRRPARLVPEALQLTFTGGEEALVRFTLPAGSYATVLLGEICHPTGSLRPGAPVDDAG